MHELAFGITGINHAFGTPINPKYPELIPGGSSSGSAAAVAAKQADFTLGTDTGGSIRMPAACCGVYGLKPTFGRVSREGVYPPSSSLDCVGPFANSVEMIEKPCKLLIQLLSRLNVLLHQNLQCSMSKQMRLFGTVYIKHFKSKFRDRFRKS